MQAYAMPWDLYILLRKPIPEYMANFSMYGVCDFSYGFAIHEIY
jgi:hypothetical protein